MSLLTSRTLLVSSLSVMTAVVLSLVSSPPPMETVASAAGSSVVTSLDPSVDVSNASSSQLRRLADALDRFSAIGMELPDLQVRFSDDDADCRDRFGLFTSTADSLRIAICSEMGWIYEHELAHAWEHATLTDRQRKEFMQLRGYRAWSDPDVPWDERGVEGVAFIVQQGLSGLSLPSALSNEHHSRLTAFRLLTGRADPRLTEWNGSGSGQATYSTDPELGP